MKKAIMCTIITLLAMAGCIGCGQAPEQKEESGAAEVANAKEEVQVKEDNDETLANGERVYTMVEVMPSFPGGEGELLKFLAKNINYPQESQEKGEKGRVICSFVVASDGSIVNHKIVRSLSPLLDKEALRVLQTMPRWTPGTQGGKPVAVKYTVPITFRLE